MARNGSKTPVKFSHGVSYLSFREIVYGTVIVSLDTAGLRVADISGLVRSVEALSIVASVAPSFVDGGAELRITLSPVGSSEYGGRTYDSPDRRTLLGNFFAPSSVRKASADAVVVRDASGKHLQTQVTLQIADGESFKSVDDPRVLNGKGGVLRARISNDGRLVFTMADPVIDDVDGKITRVIEYVAGKVETMYTGSLVVRDSNPNASLTPNNDFASSDNSQVASKS